MPIVFTLSVNFFMFLVMTRAKALTCALATTVNLTRFAELSEEFACALAATVNFRMLHAP